MPTISTILRQETGGLKDLADAQGQLRRLSNLGAFRAMPTPSERTLELTGQHRGANRRFSHVRGTFEITIEDDGEASENADPLVPAEENLCVAPGPLVRHDRCGKRAWAPPKEPDQKCHIETSLCCRVQLVGMDSTHVVEHMTREGSTAAQQEKKLRRYYRNNGGDEHVADSDLLRLAVIDCYVVCSRSSFGHGCGVESYPCAGVAQEEAVSARRVSSQFFLSGRCIVVEYQPQYI